MDTAKPTPKPAKPSASATDKRLYSAVLLLLASLAACAQTWNPRPMPYASLAVLCTPARKVYCEATSRSCLEVRRAIDEIDAVVPGLLVYGGLIDWEQIKELQATHAPVTIVANVERSIFAGRASPEVIANILGLTLLRPDAGACIGFVPLALLFTPGELSPAAEYQVVLHEMLHAIGAGHADTMLPWQTVMRPAISAEYRVALSISDRNWLRAVYGR